jgi:hypothetical protein
MTPDRFQPGLGYVLAVNAPTSSRSRPALARALAVRGLEPREPGVSNGQLRPLGSIAELEAWLNQGPLLMDGARWFGEIGYDAGGGYIRDSSGWDTRLSSIPLSGLFRNSGECLPDRS